MKAKVFRRVLFIIDWIKGIIYLQSSIPCILMDNESLEERGLK